MANRRNTLKILAAAGVIGTAQQWGKPVINTITLPAHAQTSTPTTLSCAMTDLSSNPISEGATTNQSIILTFSTMPAMPGASIDWVGRCNGVDDFAVQTDTLDSNGELSITVQTSLLCSGGPPASGDIILHTGTLITDGSTASCSIVFGP